MAMFLMHVAAYILCWFLFRYVTFIWKEVFSNILVFEILDRWVLLLRRMKRHVLFGGDMYEEIDQIDSDVMFWEGEYEALRNPDPNRTRGRGYGSEAYMARMT